MIAAPRASFTRLLRDSFESWDGRDWDHQSCVVPWEVLLDHAQERLARLENYPAARWQSRRKRPPRTIGLVGAELGIAYAHVIGTVCKYRAAFGVADPERCARPERFAMRAIAIGNSVALKARRTVVDDSWE